MHCRRALALAFACSFPAFAWADFRADFDATNQGNSPTLSRIEVGAGQMRTDSGNVTMLIDVANGRLLMVQHDKHQYMDLQKVAETAGAAMAQANAALANLPPEQRAMVEQRLGGHMPGGAGGGAKASVSVTPTGASDRVAGYACQVYRTEVNGRHVSDSCLASIGDAGIPAADQATLRKAFEQVKATTEKMSNGMFKSPLENMPGDKFPVRITQYDDAGKATQVTQIKSVTVSTVAAADFAIPADYSEQDLGSLGRHH